MNISLPSFLSHSSRHRTTPRPARRTRTVGTLVLLAIGAFLLVFTPARTAKAQYYVVERRPLRYSTSLNLGLDAEGAADVAPPDVNSSAVEGGSGFKLRIGAQIHRRFLRIIPEGGFSYTHLFVTDDARESVGWNMERTFVGVRLGFGEVIVPIVYGHIGYGWRSTSGGPVEPVPAASGVAADVGAGLDFHLIRHFGFGFHVEYVAVEATPDVPDWIAFGVHGDFAL